MSDVQRVLEKMQSPVALLYGGDSPEREVSLNSGKAVQQALESLGVPHIAVDATGDWLGELQAASIKHAIIMLHGGAGENGEVQSLLEQNGISYTGSRADASQIAMDKHSSKMLWREKSVATAPSMTLNKDDDFSEVFETLGSEVIVKPVHEGSSVGMSFAKNLDQLKEALEQAFQFDNSVLLEPRLSGPEYTIAILDGVCLPAIMLKPDGDFYDYHAKYISDATQYYCPAPVSDHQLEVMNTLCLKAFSSLGCSGWGRVDLMANGDDLYVLEVNTVPGMTDHSLVPKAASVRGISFEQLVLTIFASSLKSGTQ